MNIAIVTPPTAEPVTVPEVLDHCRIPHNDDNVYLAELIKAAREYVEKATGLAMMPTTFRMNLDAFPHHGEPLRLPRTPLISVTSVAYVDANGSSQTINLANLVVDTDSRPPRIGRDNVNLSCWPATRCERINAVTVTFVAGHANAAAAPSQLKAAIKLLVAHWYENREPVVTGTIATDIQFTIESLLGLNRVRAIF